MKTVFLRALAAEDKAATLLTAIHDRSAQGKQRFEVDILSFAAIPRSPFAYWVSEKVLMTFASTDRLNRHGRLVVSTNPLNDDFRYVRSWWEPLPHGLGQAWRPWAKGGAYSPFYYDSDTVISWDNRRTTYAGFLGTENRPLERPASVQHFFRPGLTWPRRTNGLSFRVMPVGCIFADKGPAIFVDKDNFDVLLALAAITNSRAFSVFVSLQLARTELAQSYEVGLLQTTPIPRLGPSDQSALATLAHRAWSLKRSLDTHNETSHAFSLPALLQVTGDTLAARAAAWSEHIRRIEADLAAIQVEVDSRCFELYGIDEADRRAITEGFGPSIFAPDEEGGAEDAEGDASIEIDHETRAASVLGAAALAAELVGWAVGVAFGRFDVRLATGVRAPPGEPEPFDPMPACAPGMLTGKDGLPHASAPAGYGLTFPENGVLVDDPGHPRDLTTAVLAVFDAVFGAIADAVSRDAAALLDPKGHDLRAWLATRFFEHHIKRHSKSRRKAPILWQLGTPSGLYSVWLYAHRLTRDSFFQLQNDVVVPKLAHEERQLTSLVQNSGGNPSAAERKEIATQEAFVGELRELLDEVKRVAPLWHASLDDGVVLAMAPLWRLVPQHKPWQKELKVKWDELGVGVYDWARLAMQLWPDRVVPKCAADRSLSIAHGLEDVFWLEADDGKWKPRAVPRRPVEDLVRERTSAAATAALRNPFDTRVVTAGGASGISRRTVAAAADGGTR